MFGQWWAWGKMSKKIDLLVGKKKKKQTINNMPSYLTIVENQVKKNK